jgi:hypothetical protein
MSFREKMAQKVWLAHNILNQVKKDKKNKEATGI